VRHVGDHYCVGTDRYIIADPNWTYQFGACSDIDAIADYGGTPLTGRAKTHRHAIAHNAIIAEDSVSTDDDPAKVVNAKSSSYVSFAGQFDPSEYLRYRLKQFVEERKWQAQYPRSDGVAPPAKAVSSHRPKALTCEVMLISLPVFAEIIEQDNSPLFPRHLAHSASWIREGNQLTNQAPRHCKSEYSEKGIDND
jgi:hypothetical protein